jgi:hypothetical protein
MGLALDSAADGFMMLLCFYLLQGVWSLGRIQDIMHHRGVLPCQKHFRFFYHQCSYSPVPFKLKSHEYAKAHVHPSHNTVLLRFCQVPSGRRTVLRSS